MSNIYSLKDVVEHSNPEDPWIIINNKIYGVKEFLPRHPGGEKVLKDYAGKDATAAFIKVGHSNDAKELMKDFEIGSLAGSNNKKWYCYPFYQAALVVGVIGVAVAIGITVHKIKH